jgi:hypothetical protein
MTAPPASSAYSPAECRSQLLLTSGVPPVLQSRIHTSLFSLLSWITSRATCERQNTRLPHSSPGPARDVFAANQCRGADSVIRGQPSSWCPRANSSRRSRHARGLPAAHACGGDPGSGRSRREARANLAGEAAKARARFIVKQTDGIVRRKGVTRSIAEATTRKQCEGEGVLLPDFVLPFKSGPVKAAWLGRLKRRSGVQRRRKSSMKLIWRGGGLIGSAAHLLPTPR